MSALSRKEFLALLARTTAVAAAIPVVASCGGGDDDSADGTDTSGGDCLANGTQIVIGSNHGHVVAVPAGDVEAGVEKTYTLSNIGHEHMMTLSAAHFADLQGGTSVTVQTTSAGLDSHTHAVTVNCA